MNYVTFIMDPLKVVFSIIISYIPVVVGVLAALVIGTLVARHVAKTMTTLIKNVHVDKLSHTIGLNHVLEVGGIKRPVSELIGTVIGVGITIAALVIVLGYTGVTLIGPLTDPVMTYVPTVLTAVIGLMVAMFLAHIVAVFVRLVAANTDMPRPELLSTFTKWAIMLMALRTFVDKIGFGYLFDGTPLLIMTTAIALGLALAFGLGGRDHAGRFIDRLLKH